MSPDLRRWAVAAAALAVLTAGCAKSDDAAEEVTRPPTTASTTTTTRATGVPAPLTGLTMDPDDAERPAVTVKVDNSPEARPQSGIDLADVVFEEKVEGSVVRFLAVFHSRDAEMVGPIRSVRSTDPPLVSPIGGVFAYSGGIPAFVSQIRKAPVTAISEMDHEKAFKLRVDRNRPYRTFAATDELREYADDETDPPPELFARLASGDVFQGTPAAKAVIVFGSRTTAQWDYDAKTKLWKRTTNGVTHTVEKGGQLAFKTVIVQSVAYRNTGYRDTSGSPVEEAVVTGSGDAVVLAEGLQYKVRWSKPSASAVTRYTDAAGQEVRLPAGTVWVSLPPIGSPVTIS